jgi:hypothetical protein
MRAARLAAILIAVAASAAGQEASPVVPPIPKGRPPEWSLEAGYGFSVKVNRGNSDEHLFLFEPGVAFRLGPRLEYLVEAHFAKYFTPDGYMIGVVPLGGRFYFLRGSVLPYLSLGAGIGWTNLTTLEEINRRFNFLLEGAIGVRGRVSDTQAWTFEWRWSHISNANTVLPNLGLNCSVFLVGWRF